MYLIKRIPPLIWYPENQSHLNVDGRRGTPDDVARISVILQTPFLSTLDDVYLKEVKT